MYHFDDTITMILSIVLLIVISFVLIFSFYGSEGINNTLEFISVVFQIILMQLI